MASDINQKERECKDIKHKEFYKYSCKKCCKKNSDCNTRKKPHPDGSWCHCECHHNTLFCCKCLKPVKKIGGCYFWVYGEKK